MSASRLDRLTSALVNAIEKQSNALGQQLRTENPTPPASVKLSEQEQLQQWAAMTPDKWLATVQTYGADEALDYSKSMLKLYEKHYGPIQRGAIVAREGQLNPQEPPMDQGQGMAPGMTPPGQAPSGGLPPANDANVQQIIQQAMGGVPQ